MKVSVDPAMLNGFVLALVRATAFVFVAPPFSMRAIPVTVKLGLAVGLALAAAPHVAAGAPMDTAGFVLALLVQALIGAAIGFVTYLLFSSLQAAGALVDDMSGFNLASLLDPLSDANVSIFGRFYQLVAVVLLFVTDLHLVIVKGFLTSFEAIPGIKVGDLARLLTHEMGVFMLAAVEVAGPVIAVLFLTEIAFALLSRAAPQMNVFALAFPVRVVVALVVVAIALPLILPALGNLVRQAVGSTLGL
jgi:flagellar biosynthetic protein FliR